MTVLSSSVSAPEVSSSISLPSSWERSRTSRLNLLKVVPMGSMRMFMALSRSSEVSRSTSSAIETKIGSSVAAGDLGQPGLDGDQFADQIDQLIELFSRYADAGRRLGGVARSWRDLFDMLLLDQGGIDLFLGDYTLINEYFAKGFLLLEDCLQLSGLDRRAQSEFPRVFYTCHESTLVVVDQINADLGSHLQQK